MKAPKKTYVNKLLSEWLAYVQHRHSKHTYTGYERVLRQFQQGVPARYEDLTIEHIERFLQTLKCQTNAKNTYLTAIKSFCRWCKEHHDLQNPAAKVRYLKSRPWQQRVLTEKELQKLVAIARPNTKAVLIFLSHTGLRISELRSLKEESVSPDGQLLHIIGKGFRPRTIPLNQTALKYLPAVLNFTKKYHNYYDLFCRLADKAGIEKFGPHAVRHYFATRLIGKIDIYRLSKLLGHKNTTITETIYLHFVAERDLAGALDILDGEAL